MQMKNQNIFILLCFITLVSMVFGKPHHVQRESTLMKRHVGLVRKHTVSDGGSRLVKRVPVLPVLGK